MNFDKTLGKLIGQLHHSLTRYLNDELEKAQTGITTDQFRLLTHLWQQDGQSQQDLAYCAHRDRASITRMIDILENQLIITRIPDKNDRRVNLIYLTKKGKELEKIASDCAQKSLDQMTNGFSIEEKSLFHTLLLKASDNLKS